jgi:RNA polymerase sigma-70 factor (ECF subfamily)
MGSANEKLTEKPAVRHFATTHWSIVLSAGRSDSIHVRDSLEALCRTYWHPLYSFIRRKGFSPADAQDLTQDFFTRLIEKDWQADLDRKKGKFRSFLLASLCHFLSNEIDKSKAQKRGGGRIFISIDGESAETRYRLEPSHAISAEKLFERNWAMTLLDEAMNRLRSEYVAAGREILFDTLKDTLTRGKGSQPYTELAVQLSMSESAIKVAVHRLRQRYRKVLRDEIAETVSTPDDVDDELRYLFSVLSS